MQNGPGCAATAPGCGPGPGLPPTSPSRGLGASCRRSVASGACSVSPGSPRPHALRCPVPSLTGGAADSSFKDEDPWRGGRRGRNAAPAPPARLEPVRAPAGCRSAPPVGGATSADSQSASPISVRRLAGPASNLGAGGRGGASRRDWEPSLFPSALSARRCFL